MLRRGFLKAAMATAVLTAILPAQAKEALAMSNANFADVNGQHLFYSVHGAGNESRASAYRPHARDQSTSPLLALLEGRAPPFGNKRATRVLPSVLTRGQGGRASSDLSTCLGEGISPATITPAKSRPGTRGSGALKWPETFFASLGLTPDASTLTSTSPGPGTGMGSSRSDHVGRAVVVETPGSHGVHGWLPGLMECRIGRKPRPAEAGRGDCGSSLTCAAHPAVRGWSPPPVP